MEFQTLMDALANNPGRRIELQFESGESLPPHFHVTEVGHVTKDFVDCGGVRRTTQSCVLQTLVAEDVDHRLTTDKLLGILQKSSALNIDSASPVEAEIQRESISTYAVQDHRAAEDVIVLRMAAKNTQCLAPDKCGIELNVLGDDCSEPGCC